MSKLQHYLEKVRPYQEGLFKRKAKMIKDTNDLTDTSGDGDYSRKDLSQLFKLSSGEAIALKDRMNNPEKYKAEGIKLGKILGLEDDISAYDSVKEGTLDTDDIVQEFATMYRKEKASK